MAERTSMSARLRKRGDSTAKDLLDYLLKRLLKTGRVRVTYWDNQQREYVGTTETLLPWLEVAIKDPQVVWAILREPTRGVAKAYARGYLEIAADDLPLFCQLVNENRPRTRLRMPYWYHQNITENQPAQIEDHYDRKKEGREETAALYYDLFLGATGCYTCARIDPSDAALSDEEALSRAQERKVRTTLEKLELQEGQRLLEMGCGSGYAAVYAAYHFGVRVVATTLSRVQWKTAQARAREWGVEHLVDFRLVNSLALSEAEDGQFHAILSIGMIEHMGEGNYAALVEKIDELGLPGCKVLIHGIMQDPLLGKLVGPRISPWVDEEVFQGGHLPTMAEVIHYFQQGGFVPIHMENLYVHYARTLELWWQAHTANREQIIELYGEEFYRQQTLWLVASMVGFWNAGGQPKGRLHLPQILFTKGKRADWSYVPAYTRLSL